MRRRTLLKTAAASLLAAPAIAQPARATTLRFVPQANLTVLDPVFTTAIVTGNHAYYVFDTLYSNPMDGQPRPQMAEGHEVSPDGRYLAHPAARGLDLPRRHARCAARTASPASSAGASATRSAS